MTSPPSGPRRLSRRRFLSAIGAVAVAGAAGPRAARAFTPASATLRPRFEGLPTSRTVQTWLEHMVAPGPRFTGTPSHNQFIDFLEAGFGHLGLPTHRDRARFTRWLARSWSLEVLEGSQVRRVPVAAYYSYCGRTASEGVTGKLVYLGAVPPPSIPGSPFNLPAGEAAITKTAAEVNADIASRLAGVAGGVKDSIVLMDVLIPPLFFGEVEADATYVYDPAGTLPAEDFKRAALLLATVPSLEPFKQAGAAGVVFSLDASAANAAGQYAPFIEPLQDTPSLLVDRDTGATLRSAAAKGYRARLTLIADQTPNTPTDTLWTMLPGETDEIMIVNTHTDGPNAAEENGGLALLALAHHFASLPRSARKRTMVFTCVTGHFVAEVSSTPAWIGNHLDLVGKAAAAIAIEHFGCLDWTDDPVKGYRPTGLVEPTLAFHSQTPIVAYGAQSIADNDIDRTALLRPFGVAFFGEGSPLHEAGVPTIGYVPGPNYLLSWADDQHMDKIHHDFMYRQIEWAADLLHRLDVVPAPLLKAGDSALLQPQFGSTIPIE